MRVLNTNTYHQCYRVLSIKFGGFNFPNQTIKFRMESGKTDADFMNEQMGSVGAIVVSGLLPKCRSV